MAEGLNVNPDCWKRNVTPEIVSIPAQEDREMGFPYPGVHVVPSNEWQAARPLGAYALVGCTVGPGFEFEDFEMNPGPL